MAEDDIDAEFERLVAGMENAESGETGAGGGRPGAADLDKPVDESLHLEGGKRSVALVLAPIASATALAGLLHMLGQSVWVVRVKPYTAAWLSIPAKAQGADELEELLADRAPLPPQVDGLAVAVSRLSRYGAVALVSWLVEGAGVEPGVSGQITARRYVDGKAEASLPAGVVLGGLDQRAEDLLLGRTTPRDYRGAVHSGKQGRRPGFFRRGGRA